MVGLTSWLCSYLAQVFQLTGRGVHLWNSVTPKLLAAQHVSVGVILTHLIGSVLLCASKAA